MQPIFFIGFNKIATKSLHMLFDANGYKSIHWMDKNKRLDILVEMKKNIKNNREILHGELGKYDIFIDFLSDRDLYLYKNLYEEYPNAKFVFQTRRKAKWILSRLNFQCGNYIKHMNRENGTQMDWKEFATLWSKMYDSYSKEVFDFFRDKDNFFMFDLDKMNLKELVQFMGLDIDNPKLPHTHKTTKKIYKLEDIEPYI